MTLLYDLIDHDIWTGHKLGGEILDVTDNGGHVLWLSRSGSMSVLMPGAIHRVARVRYAATQQRRLQGDGFPLEIGEDGREQFNATACGWWAGPLWRSTPAARVEVLPTVGSWPQEPSVELIAHVRDRWVAEVRARGDDVAMWASTPAAGHPEERCDAPLCLRAL